MELTGVSDCLGRLTKRHGLASRLFLISSPHFPSGSAMSRGLWFLVWTWQALTCSSPCSCTTPQAASQPRRPANMNTLTKAALPGPAAA
jgi:hypothetical protein